MNVLLINPSIDKWKYGVFEPFYEAFHPISLVYIASAVKEMGGHNVSVIDMEAENLSLKQITQILIKKRPDILMMSVLTPAAVNAEELCKITRRHLKDTIIILGNLHASCFAESLITLGYADYVVHGEGEETIRELLKAIDTKSDLSGIRGISYFQNGRCITTQKRAAPANLDEIPPPDWSLLNMSRYKINSLTKLKGKGVPIFSTRGCPYKCTFCSFDTLSRVPRYRSPENVIEEIDRLIKDYNINFLWFLDPIFGVNKEHSSRLLELMIKRNYRDLKWVCEMRADSVDREFIRLMRQAGCERIFIGFESGVDKLLEGVNKKAQAEQGRKAAEIIHREGIQVAGLFMIGLPGEKPEETDQTINYACNLDIDFAKFAITIPLPGSPLFDEYYNSGKLKRPDWNNYLTFTMDPDILVNINGVQTNKQLVRKLMEAHIKFYTKPDRLLRHLLSVRTLNILDFIKGLNVIIRRLVEKD
ncbi:MAG: B12-binding domain-containing radical SAM protein [Deltaproteobacteria bacterium]|nr:B12-binding domain-containing radical SAM protein [Deltaproteobacteria bacterium]